MVEIDYSCAVAALLAVRRQKTRGKLFIQSSFL